MLALTLDNVRIFLHVTAATIWVGGQLVLGALVPALRKASPDAPHAAAVAFGRIAWPAFGVLIATGIWNIAAEDITGAARTTLHVKLGVVVLSGVSAYLHTKASTPKARGIWGGVTGLSALVAVLLGVQLAG
jgi:putative copper export protein